MQVVAFFWIVERGGLVVNLLGQFLLGKFRHEITGG